MQRLLLIVNPCAGTKRIPRFFPQIIELFRALDAFDCVLQYTRSGRIAVTRGMQEQVSAFLEERESSEK